MKNKPIIQGSYFHLGGDVLFDSESLLYKYDKHVYSSISFFQHNPQKSAYLFNITPPDIPHTANVW